MNQKSPFSLYDFIGYFFPGFFTVTIFALYYLTVNNYSIESVDFKLFKLSNDEQIFFINGSIIIYGFIIIISYILGHFINYLSSVSVEKYSNWMYGYPANFLLNKEKPTFYKCYKKNEVRVWIDEINKKNILYKLVKKFRNSLIESSKKSLVKVGCVRIRAFFWRTFLLIFLFPITLLDFLIGNFLGMSNYYANKLDPTLIKLINEKIILALKNMGLDQYDFDFQRIINHYYYEKYPSHKYRLEYYVSLYGFLRSLSLVFSIAAILFLLESIFMSIGLSVIAYIFYMAFMKFYRRFALENYMCFLVDDSCNLIKKI